MEANMNIHASNNDATIESVEELFFRGKADEYVA
jgi:hypothetical protein